MFIPKFCFVYRLNGTDVLRNELDDEVYELSYSIMQGTESGNIFIESRKEKAYWDIVK